MRTYNDRASYGRSMPTLPPEAQMGGNGATDELGNQYANRAYDESRPMRLLAISRNQVNGLTAQVTQLTNQLNATKAQLAAATSQN